jgi:hypothetical protein
MCLMMKKLLGSTQLKLPKYEISIENINISLSEEENKDFWSNREVEFHLGEYLNLKFKRFD